MDHRFQRDRFMAFSFTAADCLVEVDEAGTVLFAIGATTPLGERTPEALTGASLLERIGRADRALVTHILTGLKPGRRAGPVNVRLSGGAVASLNMCAMPDVADRRYLTIAYRAASAGGVTEAPRDDTTGLVAHEAFEAIATDALDALKAQGKDAALTFLTLEGQEALASRLAPDAGATFFENVGAILRAASVNDAASQVGDGRFSLVHEAGVDTSLVEAEIAALASAADPTGVGVQVGRQTMKVDGGMNARDAARALVYAVNTFAAGDGDMSMASMSEALSSMLEDAQTRIVEFKSAIADHRVDFVAQPIVELKTRDVSHYELLVRFEDGVSPFEMVNFAEKTGIIADLDMAVFEFAHSFLANTAPKGFAGLAVNVSGLSVVKPAFTDALVQRLRACPFARSRLAFEITESAEISDLEAADRAIQQLRGLGHRVYLDDFGAGAASFPYLRALDVDGVKIDGAYVRSAFASRRDGSLLKAMAALCVDLGVTTIAEMVETEDQLNHLRRLGVQKGQGYLFGKPTSLARFGKPKGVKAA